jgi:hypothetical protein
VHRYTPARYSIPSSAFWFPRQRARYFPISAAINKTSLGNRIGFMAHIILHFVTETRWSRTFHIIAQRHQDRVCYLLKFADL